MVKQAIIENGRVVNVVLVASLPQDGVAAIGCSIGDFYDNGAFTKPPVDTAAETARLIASVTESTQKRLDDFAKSRNYDGILSACTYATSAGPKFASEGQYCVNARDATWATLYTVMAEVEAQTRPMPSGYADIEPLLPALVWPA